MAKQPEHDPRQQEPKLGKGQEHEHAPEHEPEEHEAPEGSTEYTVFKDDTLSSIAQRFYGNGTEPYWRKIYDVNKRTIGPNPDYLQIGQKLMIPPDQKQTVGGGSA